MVGFTFEGGVVLDEEGGDGGTAFGVVGRGCLNKYSRTPIIPHMRNMVIGNAHADPAETGGGDGYGIEGAADMVSGWLDCYIMFQE